MSVYRTPSEMPKRYRGLVAECRRCGCSGRVYLYFPTSAGVDAGPLCQECFVTWRGVALNWRFGAIGVGRSTWPVEDRWGPPSYDTVEIYGEEVYEPELRQPSINASWGCYEEISFLSRLVRWLCG